MHSLFLKHVHCNSCLCSTIHHRVRFIRACQAKNETKRQKNLCVPGQSGVQSACSCSTQHFWSCTTPIRPLRAAQSFNQIESAKYVKMQHIQWWAASQLSQTQAFNRPAKLKFFCWIMFIIFIYISLFQHWVHPFKKPKLATVCSSVRRFSGPCRWKSIWLVRIRDLFAGYIKRKSEFKTPDIHYVRMVFGSYCHRSWHFRACSKPAKRTALSCGSTGLLLPVDVTDLESVPIQKTSREIQIFKNCTVIAS